VLAIVISCLTNKFTVGIFATLVALGISMHAFFGIPTALNKHLGLAPNENKAFNYNQDIIKEWAPYQGYHKNTCLLG
jgi:hypothetical protein